MAIINLKNKDLKELEGMELKIDGQELKDPKLDYFKYEEDE